MLERLLRQPRSQALSDGPQNAAVGGEPQSVRSGQDLLAAQQAPWLPGAAAPVAAVPPAPVQHSAVPYTARPQVADSRPAFLASRPAAAGRAAWPILPLPPLPLGADRVRYLSGPSGRSVSHLGVASDADILAHADKVLGTSELSAWPTHADALLYVARAVELGKPVNFSDIGRCAAGLANSPEN
ncbi:MAG: hypothetical protein EOO40_07270, partial [Deltaproteobacteria bacterium]